MQAPIAPNECAEKDKLQAEYREAVLLWIELGGANAEVMHLPRAVGAKRGLDAAAIKLAEHRKQHGC